MDMNHQCHGEGPCLCPPHPDLVRRLATAASGGAQHPLTAAVRSRFRRLGHPTSSTPGLNDGAVIPPTKFPEGTSLRAMRKAALEREDHARGEIRAIAVLVDFPDQKMKPGNVQHLKRLFSTQKGSVNEYYKEVSGGRVSVVGDLVGPYTLPRELTAYAHGSSGFGDEMPNSQTMARDALDAIKATQNMDVYDINGDGVVDAFVVIHAGSGAEEDDDTNKLWSLQWNIGDAVTVGNVSVYGFLTIPEDALLGVAVHELGHLLFSWPDLYDIDSSSTGLGSWCLMSGGSWNGFPAGSTPCHPSAWCKYKQGWVSVITDTENQPIRLGDVKDTNEIHRLWRKGDPTSDEYFLIENRQRAKYDTALPGDGLLVWHIDDNVPDNHDELHYKVGLAQADGKNELATRSAASDDGDPYPGSTNNVTFNDTSNPNSRSYAKKKTGVSISSISQSSRLMSMNIAVK